MNVNIFILLISAHQYLLVGYWEVMTMVMNITNLTFFFLGCVTCGSKAEGKTI